mmetsp:Transcript_1512/g.3569  ORF Transcript_1512/g.3569 Transcript_1512/m.3569 type:complete len:205 (-) Transcript_1512:1106-1720(-)
MEPIDLCNSFEWDSKSANAAGDGVTEERWCCWLGSISIRGGEEGRRCPVERGARWNARVVSLVVVVVVVVAVVWLCVVFVFSVSVRLDLVGDGRLAEASTTTAVVVVLILDGVSFRRPSPSFLTSMAAFLILRLASLASRFSLANWMASFSFSFSFGLSLSSFGLSLSFLGLSSAFSFGCSFLLGGCSWVVSFSRSCSLFVSRK